MMLCGNQVDVKVSFFLCEGNHANKEKESTTFAFPFEVKGEELLTREKKEILHFSLHKNLEAEGGFIHPSVRGVFKQETNPRDQISSGIPPLNYPLFSQKKSS